MTQLDSASVYSWQWPIDLAQYDRSPYLSETEKYALASWSNTRRVRAALPRLYSPLQDAEALSSKQSQLNGHSKAQTAILQEMQRTQQPYWAWSQQAWIDLVCRPLIHPSARLFISANAYLHCDFRLVHRIGPIFYLSALGRLIFGKELFEHECGRLHQTLQKMGYGKIKLQQRFPSILAAVMLENRNPYLESIDDELLERTREKYSTQARSIGKISHGLAAQGILPHPLRMRNERFVIAAYAAIEKEYDCERKLKSAKSEGVQAKRQAAYTQAIAYAEKAITLYDDFSYLYRCVISELNVFDNDGNLRHRQQAETGVICGLALIEDLNHTLITKAVNKVRRAVPDLFHYFDIAKKVVNKCKALGITEEGLKAYCIAWQWGKAARKAKKSGRKKLAIEQEQFC
ncbi:MAG: hypothetical protein WC856_05270 [Methylococcaceae bacterium]|jgi:hypothetical protein